MSQTSDCRLLMVWVGLVIVTAISWTTGSSGSAPMQVDGWVTFIVLAISAVKARVIIREFMEVSHASRALRMITDGWVCFTFFMLVATYLYGKTFWVWMDANLHLLPPW